MINFQKTQVAAPFSTTCSTKEYELASLWRVLGARIFDLSLAAIPGVLLRFFLILRPGNWGILALNLSLTLIFTEFYFFLLPVFLKGQTLGKLIFGIRLKAQGASRPAIRGLFFRECYFLLPPWIVGVICQVLAVVMMKPYQGRIEDGTAPGFGWALLLTQIAYLFYLAWFLYLFLTIKVQADHQSLIDCHYHFFVVKAQPIINSNPVPKSQRTHELGPGELPLTTLKELIPEEFAFEIVPSEKKSLTKDSSAKNNERKTFDDHMTEKP